MAVPSMAYPCRSPRLGPPSGDFRVPRGGWAKSSPSFQPRHSRIQRLKAAKLDIQQSPRAPAMLPILFVSAAVANRVSNRVLLAPLLRHTYFLALTTTLAQLSIYCVWLWQSFRQGQIRKAMWDYAMSNPVLLGAFGLCEGAFFPLVFYSAARLPGSLVQVLNQSLIPFTVLFSFIFLSRRYDRIQLLGVLVVLCGVTLFTSLPRSTGSSSVFVILCIAAYGLQAAAMVVKESVFVQFSQKQARGGSESSPFDASLFLTIGTCCRCAVQLLAWPLFLQLVSPGLGIRSSATAGAMAMMHPAVLPLTIFYIMANVGISITALLLVQKSSASTVVLANVVALPLSALLFCLPLPSLERQVFQWRFAVSLLLIVLGNLLYSHRSLTP